MGSCQLVNGLCSPPLSPLELTPFLSLSALPFASNHFDFVRIRYIGLAVPEDKVQSPTSPKSIVFTDADCILPVARSLRGEVQESLRSGRLDTRLLRRKYTEC